MTEADAVNYAMDFVKKHTGIVQRPSSVRYIERGGGRRYWSVTYMPDVFFAAEAASGSTIDGPYVLHVDDKTGQVVVLG